MHKMHLLLLWSAAAGLLERGIRLVMNPRPSIYNIIGGIKRKEGGRQIWNSHLCREAWWYIIAAICSSSHWAAFCARARVQSTRRAAPNRSHLAQLSLELTQWQTAWEVWRLSWLSPSTTHQQCYRTNSGSIKIVLHKSGHARSSLHCLKCWCRMSGSVLSPGKRFLLQCVPLVSLAFAFNVPAWILQTESF